MHQNYKHERHYPNISPKENRCTYPNWTCQINIEFSMYNYNYHNSNNIFSRCILWFFDNLFQIYFNIHIFWIEGSKFALVSDFDLKRWIIEWLIFSWFWFFLLIENFEINYSTLLEYINQHIFINNALMSLIQLAEPLRFCTQDIWIEFVEFLKANFLCNKGKLLRTPQEINNIWAIWNIDWEKLLIVLFRQKVWPHLYLH